MDYTRDSMYILQTLQILGLVEDRNQLFEPILRGQLVPLTTTEVPYDSYLVDDMFNNLVSTDLGLGLHVEKHLLVPGHQLRSDTEKWRRD